MFDKNIRAAFISQVIAAFTWVLTLGSAVVFIIGGFVADWSWNLLWISGGLLVLAMLLSIFTFTKFFKAAEF